VARHRLGAERRSRRKGDEGEVTVFDIREQTDRAHAVTPDDIDAAAFAAQPLSRPALRCLRYLADVEGYTIRYLRDLLVTPSHTDPVVTEFLTAWAFQQYWLGETLEAVLTAHDSLPATPPPTPLRRAAQNINDRIAPIQKAAVANLIGEEFVAVHMTMGAVSERLVTIAYQQLSAIEIHPELSAIMDRICVQKARHVEFYQHQARARLDGSARARTITRFALRRLARGVPSGATIHPKRETRFVLAHLFHHPDALAGVRQLDRDISDLPGLTGLRPAERALARHGIRARAVIR
jgi:hypothetical protein